MLWLLRTILLTPIGVTLLVAQQPECLANLEPPQYPPLAWGSEDQRLVEITVNIEADGKPVLAVSDSDDDLAVEASRVVGLSTFAQSCSGRRLELRFRFELSGEGSIERRSTFSFGPDNAVVITAKPPSALCGRAITSEAEAAESYGQGLRLSLAKSYIEAIQCFDRKIAFAPEADAYIERGIARRKSGQLKPAIEDYDEAIRLRPDDSIAFLNRGNVYRDLGRDQEAIRDYTEAIRIDPMRVEAYGNRGVRFFALGMLQPALEDFSALIQARPRERLAYLNRGAIYVELNHPELAIADFDQAVRLSPLEADAFNNRGNARFRLGEYEAALADYDKAIQLSPDYFEAWVGRGSVHQSLKQYKEAENDLTTAIRLQPDSGVAYRTRGDIRLQNGDGEGAAADLDKAKTLGCEPKK